MNSNSKSPYEPGKIDASKIKKTPPNAISKRQTNGPYDLASASSEHINYDIKTDKMNSL